MGTRLVKSERSRLASDSNILALHWSKKEKNGFDKGIIIIVQRHLLDSRARIPNYNNFKSRVEWGNQAT